jgi:hypothetical protein
MKNNMQLDGMDKIELDPRDVTFYSPAKGRMTTQRELDKAKRGSWWNFPAGTDAKVRFLDAATPMPFFTDISGSMSAVTETGKEELKQSIEKLSAIIKEYAEMYPIKNMYYTRPSKYDTVIKLDSLSMVTDDMKTYKDDGSDDLRMNILKARQQETDNGFFYAPYIPDLYSKNEYKVVEPLGSTDTLSKEEFTAEPRDLYQNNLCQEILETPSKFPLKGKPLNVNTGDLDIASFYLHDLKLLDMYDGTSLDRCMAEPCLEGKIKYEYEFFKDNPCGEIPLMKCDTSLAKEWKGFALDLETSVNGMDTLDAFTAAISNLNLYEGTTYAPLPKFLTTYNDALDNILGGGLKPGSVTLIAANAGVGKSALAKYIAASQSINGVEFVYLTAEEYPDRVIQRIQELNGHNTETNYRVAATLNHSTYGLIETIRAKVDELDNARIVFIDELTFFKDMGSNTLGKELRQVAMELDIAIVATNQLARQSLDADQPLTMASGDYALTNAVDNVIGMRRQGHDVELTSMKCRETAAGKKAMFSPFHNIVWEPVKVEVPELITMECTFGGEGRGSHVTELPSGNFAPIKHVTLPISKRTFADLKAAFAPKVEDNYPTADWL